MAEVEFAAWETPFKDGELTILDVRFETGHSEIAYQAEGIGFTLPRKYGLGDAGLTVRLFHKETAAVYALSFERVGAFRLLDEHGLLELWEETDRQGGRPAQSTFKVRNHLWSKESPLSFVHHAKDDWSFVIATDWDCVEIVCEEPPDIQLEEKVSRRPLS